MPILWPISNNGSYALYVFNFLIHSAKSINLSSLYYDIMSMRLSHYKLLEGQPFRHFLMYHICYLASTLWLLSHWWPSQSSSRSVASDPFPSYQYKCIWSYLTLEQKDENVFFFGFFTLKACDYIEYTFNKDHHSIAPYLTCFTASTI